MVSTWGGGLCEDYVKTMIVYGSLCLARFESGVTRELPHLYDDAQTFFVNGVGMGMYVMPI